MSSTQKLPQPPSTKGGPLNDTEAACAALTTVGDALTAAATHQLHIINLADGWPARGNSAGRGGGTTSTTEHAAIALCDDDADYRHEASRAKSAIEDMRDWWSALRIMLADGARLAAIHRPKAERADAMLCDGRQFEGSEMAWVPHSRAHDNGWHDPLCMDIADDSGLCDRCKVRERRWRVDHGMQPRKRNSAQDAQAA